MFSRLSRASILLGLPLVLGLGVAYAEDTGSISPYIDSIKAKLKPETERSSEEPDPYIQAQKRKLEEQGKGQAPKEGVQPYIDHLKAQNPSLNEPTEKAPGSYTEEQKAKLGPEQGEGAIEAYHEGKSQLQMKRPGKVTGSFGLKVGAAVSHSYSGSSDYVANSYSEIYGGGWIPDLTFQGEYYFINNPTFGSLGIEAMAGFTISKGTGRFAIQLYRPADNSLFPLASKTKTTFITIPGTVGARYQFNAGKYIRPYALIGPTLVTFSETRNDGIGAKNGLSKGLTTNAGVAILLDWIGGRQNAWDMYQDFAIKHYYLNLEYSKLTTFASNIDISYSGLDVGFTFEF